MADKTYVHVAKFGVKEAFDTKYKTRLPAIMQKTVERAVEKSSRLTTKTPKDKKEEGFYIDGSLTLEKDEKNGKCMLAGKISMQLATWPKRSMFAFPSGSAKLEVARPEKIDGDVEYLVQEMVDSLLKDKVVKELEKRSK